MACLFLFRREGGWMNESMDRYVEHGLTYLVKPGGGKGLFIEVLAPIVVEMTGGDTTC